MKQKMLKQYALNQSFRVTSSKTLSYNTYNELFVIATAYNGSKYYS